MVSFRLTEEGGIVASIFFCFWQKKKSHTKWTLEVTSVMI
ncbi:hypothetical protein ISR6_1419 [Streptococcus pyogenes]|nr:hypothetical protein ISR6_1419 [Streptococcus pyogenes]